MATDTTTLTRELSHTGTLAETSVHEHAHHSPSPTSSQTCSHSACTQQHVDTCLYTHIHKLRRDLHLLCDEFGVFFSFFMNIVCKTN